MKTAILVVVLLLVLGFPVFYIWKSKKSGKKCIGCPHAGGCSHKCGGL